MTFLFIAFEAIQPENEDAFLEVSLSFSCKKPVSTVVKLKFTDEQNREYFYNVTVTADNSLFTCHAFLADHQTDYQIIVENVCLFVVSIWREFRILIALKMFRVT